jgi:hypothetical protein
MKTSSDVLDRIMQVAQVTTDVNLAGLLNVKPSTVATWRRRNSIPFKKIVAFCQSRHVSLSHVICGQGDPYIDAGRQGLDALQEKPGLAEVSPEYGSKSVDALADIVQYYGRTTERLNAELREKERQIAESAQLRKAISHVVEFERPPDGIQERRRCIQFIKRVLETD